MKTIHKSMIWLLAVAVCLTGAVVGGRGLGQPREQTTEQAPRPTSTPYVGDLSIFEYPERDEKLQVQHVMDLLGIVKARRLRILELGQGGSPYGRRHASAPTAWCMPRTSILRQLLILRSAR